ETYRSNEPKKHPPRSSGPTEDPSEDTLPAPRGGQGGDEKRPLIFQPRTQAGSRPHPGPPHQWGGKRLPLSSLSGGPGDRRRAPSRGPLLAQAVELLDVVVH